MGLTLDELITLKTKEELKAQALVGLQGIGYVAKDGIGSGAVTADGVAAGDYSIRIKISTTGERGSGEFQLSTDAGASYAAAVVIPSGGVYAVGSTGATVYFTNGSAGAGNSFESGDVFSFETTTPTLPVTSWQEGSTPLTLIENDAEANEDFSRTIQQLAKGATLADSAGPWLDLWMASMYGLSRLQGQINVGNMLLSDTGNGGPYTINIGDLWVGTIGGLRWNNITGGTLTMGGTLSLSWRAEQPGSKYNVGAGSVNLMFTSLAGVVISNPNPLAGSWITTAGADRETDAAARKRCQSRWPNLGIGVPQDSYDLWARTASPTVTRTRVRASDTVPGQIDVILAGAGGGVDGAVVSTVQAYLNPRAALTSVPVAISATVVAVTVNATLYVRAGYGTRAFTDATTNVAAYFNGGTNTNGELMPGIGIAETVYLTGIIEQLMLAAGARNTVISLPTTDVGMGPTDVPSLTLNLTVVEV